MARGDWTERLTAWCAEAGLELPQDKAEGLSALAELVAEWGPGLGLTAIRNPQDVLLKHVADSVLLAAVVRRPQSLVDLGCGVGLPGLGLATLWPGTRTWLVDSRSKAAHCALHLSSELGLRNVRVCHGRAEEEETWAQVGKVDVVVTRGFSPARELARAARPYVGERTLVAVYSGPGGGGDPVREAFRAAGLVRQSAVEVQLASVGWTRWFWLAAAAEGSKWVLDGSAMRCFT